VAWLVIGFSYLYVRKLTKGIPILHAEDHKEKLQAAMSAPPVTVAEAATGD